MNASDFKYTATTPKTITEPIRQFCHELSVEEPVVLDVCPDAFADQGRCYINASEVAQRLGGKVVLGWLVWELAGVYVTAEHHAVVEIDGKMIDVTPPFAGEHKVVFVPDAITEHRSQIIPNRYASLVASELIARFVKIAARKLDLEARSAWLKTHRQRLLQSLKRHPKWYDLECAAYFVWVQSVKISTNGTSVVLRRTAGVRRRNQDLATYFTALAERLKNVTIHFGDWTKLANAATRESLHSDVAILLDPPYKYATGRQKKLYVTDSGDVAEYVHRWALAISQTRPKLKIALCGFAGEHKMPPEWDEVAWQSKLGKGKERIWFSPSCHHPAEPKTEAVYSRDTIQPLPVVIRSEDDGMPLGCRPVSVLTRY